ncbi:hypothetical protein NHX12_030145 [Muraenolepis orangiensis]|uniref:Lipoma HMGIC fusion partner-like 4 protein n=1 Tax=Muraenolepis orangiensis TaxID=630683 RepID=A0A9Q0EBI2_9TELE|nr:hypothetical protein NHX12_030145 [Muraenolepis orangiensis]
MLPSQEASKIYHDNYMRNSHAIGVLWAIFTILLAIINVVVFIEPFWIGDSMNTPYAGHFGLFHYCVGGSGSPSTLELTCQGTFSDPSSGAFRAASFFVLLAMVLTLSCIACFALFFFCNTSTVYKTCAWMQLLCVHVFLVPPRVAMNTLLAQRSGRASVPPPRGQGWTAFCPPPRGQGWTAFCPPPRGQGWTAFCPPPRGQGWTAFCRPHLSGLDRFRFENHESISS